MRVLGIFGGTHLETLVRTHPFFVTFALFHISDYLLSMSWKISIERLMFILNYINIFLFAFVTGVDDTKHWEADNWRVFAQFRCSLRLIPRLSRSLL